MTQVKTSQNSSAIEIGTFYQDAFAASRLAELFAQAPSQQINRILKKRKWLPTAGKKQGRH